MKHNTRKNVECEAIYACVSELIGALETHSIQMAACGLDHSVAINENGQVLCWGGNIHGQLGRGNTDIKHTHVPRLAKLCFKVIYYFGKLMFLPS